MAKVIASSYTESYSLYGTAFAQAFQVPSNITRITSARLRYNTLSVPLSHTFKITGQQAPNLGANPNMSVVYATVNVTKTSGGTAWVTFNFADFAITGGTFLSIVFYQSAGNASNTIMSINSSGAGGGQLGGGATLPPTNSSPWAAADGLVFDVYGYGKPQSMGNAPTSATGDTWVTISSSVGDDNGDTISERGFCWGTSANPTISNNKKVVGSGEGSFSTTITGLSRGTHYYIRSYATNSAGTSYSIQNEFTTSAIAPSVITDAVSGITPTTADLYGNVTSDNGATVSERGFVYATTTDPIIGGGGVTKQTVSGTIGNYVYNATGLSALTTYYVKAYAINSAGTSYGAQQTFTTTLNIPSVTTGSASSLTDSTATLGGDVTSSNGSTITERGVAYGLALNPTISGTKVSTTGTTGAYTVDVTGFTPGTEYHFRAYAVSSEGTAYGSDQTFTTLPVRPATLTATKQGKTQVDLTWTIGTGATKTVIRRKVGSYPANISDGTEVYNGTGTSYSNTGLTAGTAYYYSAWALQGTSNYSSNTRDANASTDYSFSNITNIYASDASYASAPANDNKIYVKLSKDGGTTFVGELEQTLPGVNGEVTFGRGTEELWGTTWTGDDVDDTSFRLMVTLGSNKTSYQTLKNFGFVIDNAYLLTGIEVIAKGYYSSGTSYIDSIKVKCYYGSSVVGIQEGSQVYDSDTQSLKIYNGSSWEGYAHEADLATHIADTSAHGFDSSTPLVTWTPSFTNFTIGNGTVNAKYSQLGKWTYYYVSVILGSTSSFSGGTPTMTLPATSISYPGTAGLQIIGEGRIYRVGVYAPYVVFKWATTTTGTLSYYVADTNKSYQFNDQSISATAPFTWQTGDEIFVSGMYMAA